MMLRWTAVILVAAVTFALLYGADYAFGRSFTLKPLREALLSHPSVKAIEIIKAKKPVVIQTELHDGVDLKRSVEELEEIVGEFVGDKGSVVVKENDSPELLKAYDKVHLAVIEAIRTGKFTLLEDNIQKLLTDSEIKVSVQVTLHRMYISVSGSSGTLYKIIDY